MLHILPLIPEALNGADMGDDAAAIDEDSPHNSEPEEEVIPPQLRLRGGAPSSD